MDLASLRAFIFDLDGCVYYGNTLLPGVAAVLGRLRASGRRVSFLTNNSRETGDVLLGKLRRLGLAAEPEEIVSAAEAAAPFVRQRYGPARVLAVGSERLLSLLAAAGHTLLPLEDYRRAQVVVIGHDETVDYRKLTALARAVHGGAAFVAVNVDPQLVVEEGEIFPGCGAIVEAVAAAAGIRPAVVGKPEPHVFQVALERLGLAPQSVVMVGDSIHADICGAQRVGLRTIWMTPVGADPGRVRPDLTIHAYAEILSAL
jgi:HAD superfamily hydrolase (TIGR01450 family)